MFFDKHVEGEQTRDEVTPPDQPTDHQPGQPSVAPSVGPSVFAMIGAIIFGTITVLMLFNGVPGALISLTDFEAANKVYFGECVVLIVLAIIPAVLAKLCLVAAQRKKKAE